MPAALNVAVVFFAALVPLAEKLTAAGGVPVVDQVYDRLGSPPPSLSAPRTERLVVVPVTGEAAAAVATVGAASVTVTAAGLLLTSPLVAVTVAAPDANGAV